MKNRFFSWLARFIYQHQRLWLLIIKYAEHRPYYHLANFDGSPYMSRWWLMPKWCLELKSEGIYWPKSWLPFVIRLHHIRSEDKDRDLHDHPADYRTLLIDGKYVEQDIFNVLHFHAQGSSRSARAETFHKIINVSEGGVWTIFIMKNRHNSWGFLKDGFKIHWREYVDQKQLIVERDRER